ncbi:MAG TPA: hypothetical protein VM386_04720, partial [Acidimicrobiales bacterium]|nr:hypothetical protein [Acidimicrobiales bacterium]
SLESLGQLVASGDELLGREISQFVELVVHVMVSLARTSDPVEGGAAVDSTPVGTPVDGGHRG